MPNNTFDDDAVTRIAAVVKNAERPNASFSYNKNQNNVKPQVHRAIKITGAIDATRQQYPGRFVTYTPGTGGVATWVNMDTLAPSGQDCWVETDGATLSIDNVVYGLLVYGEDSDGRPVFIATGGGNGVLSTSYVFSTYDLDTLPDLLDTIVIMPEHNKPAILHVTFRYSFSDETPVDATWIDEASVPLSATLPIQTYHNYAKFNFAVRRYLLSGEIGDGSDELMATTGYIDSLCTRITPLPTYDPITSPDDFIVDMSPPLFGQGDIHCPIPPSDDSYVYYIAYYILETGFTTIGVGDRLVTSYNIQYGENPNLYQLPPTKILDDSFLIS